MCLPCWVIFSPQGVCASADNAGPDAGQWLLWYVHWAGEVSCWNFFGLFPTVQQSSSALPWGCTGLQCESLLHCLNFPQVGQTALKGSWQNPWLSCLCRILLLVPCLTARTLIKLNFHVSPGILGQVSGPFFTFQLPKSLLAAAHSLLYWEPWALAVSCVVLQSPLCLWLPQSHCFASCECLQRC